MDAGIQGQAGPSFNHERCAGGGLPSLALGPGILPGRRRSRLTARSVIPAWMPESSARQGHRANLGVVLAEGCRPGTGSRHPAGTTEIAVDHSVRHSGMDAGIQGQEWQ